MSQVNVEQANVTQQQVLDDLSAVTGAPVGVGDLAKIVQVRYEVALSQLLQNLSDMSTRSICRILSNAIDLPIQSGLGKKFVNEYEAKNAALLAQVIDMRNILQADKMQKEEDAKLTETKGETSESV